jgi:UDP-3-O-[3-hydroxymyristoyl] N-acetylglucosamine deacetylase
MQKNIKILVVDDELSIRRTLEGIFRDEGYSTLLAEDGETALRVISQTKPDLVVLDIWMPGMDGIETLRRIKQLYPDLPVVMVSGHATIATAVTATRLGASDFVEKPLDLHRIIQSVQTALSSSTDKKSQIENNDIFEGGAELSFSSQVETTGINPVVFSKNGLEGKPLTKKPLSQKTLANNAILYGQGLHTGKKSGLILEPLPPYSGIHFVGVSENTPVPAHVDYVESTGFATTVKLGSTQAGTIEHLMSALHAYGITNLLIKCNGEVPVMDGSARDFCILFEEVGIEDQKEPWHEIVIDTEYRIGNDKEYIKIEPADKFIIDYTLSYPEPLGTQHYVFTLDGPESYKNEIAPARTFGFVKDVGFLQKQGLALGGRFDNFVLYGQEGAINDKLRFDNEAVRHKILDAVGDLFLLGRKIRGKVTAHMTGHSDNIELLKMVSNQLKAIKN